MMRAETFGLLQIKQRAIERWGRRRSLGNGVYFYAFFLLCAVGEIRGGEGIAPYTITFKITAIAVGQGLAPADNISCASALIYVFFGTMKGIVPYRTIVIVVNSFVGVDALIDPQSKPETRLFI